MSTRIAVPSLLFAGGLILSVFATVGRASDHVDPDTLFASASEDRSIGRARKTKVVDARPAVAGEIIVTVIQGEGEETRSKPAVAGDMVVRNRCPATGNEQYLVKASKFAERYGQPIGPANANGWTPFRPQGTEMLFVVVRDEDGAFSFTAPWGEPMVARPGDAIVRNPADLKDTYRVAAASFACTYEILEPARSAP